MDDWLFPYQTTRMPVLARNVVATSQPLAAQAGLSMLHLGGNAVDAALAAAITLTVVEPTGNGVGGDAFAQVWDGSRLYGLNGSGCSPLAWTAEHFAGRQMMPLLGWDAVTVPGAVSAWSALSQRFGKLPFAELFKPAIGYARYGFAVTPIIAERWRETAGAFGDFPEFCRVFLPGGRPPRPGQVVVFPELAESLEELADSGGESLYRGPLAERIARCAEQQGGMLDRDDLARHRPLWVQPLSLAYRGHTVHELPPNGQGIAVLLALGILSHFEIAAHPVDSAGSVHLQAEAMKLAFADVFRHLADAQAMRIDVAELLDPAYLAERASLIDPHRASFPTPGPPGEPGTVYLASADQQGMMVSLIQSNYHGFGSGIVVPGTGISLHNRGCGFVLTPDHPNRVGGGKRPFHTIIPAFVSREGEPVAAFGVMGAHMQAQGHVQMMIRLFDYGQHPQAASDAPRWHVNRDLSLSLEEGFPEDAVAGLTARGQRLVLDTTTAVFGGAQLVRRLANGWYLAGSDHRKDGQAVGF
ncbi:gamma-glutamyltransferase family protein [Desulfofustis limnaeus]|jgi:gamma-glutamyltranspeptidase/glutathione hydrolase|uniref:Gamma-glutamyltransferase n=1 Tax=Desulfofustis limnaeus TaxID=2740163 RepID=A0ABM7WBG2_9BACT|nr:gamma-glutamyltransferase family protein [Desulfofustis limnaeus]MDX9894548.1 gamma-glutamyltransferase family protein [Desulfofustis sp.]BDD88330.1 gamma-glutamyltransferase [Desulfofustis limnaeus]